MSDAADTGSDPTYTHFAHKDEFFELLSRFLQIDISEDVESDEEREQEDLLVRQIGWILNYYLPLPGLLDPYLSDIVPPLVAVLSDVVRVSSQDGITTSVSLCRERVARLGQLLNWVVKLRGWKGISPYFSSDITYLPKLVTVLSDHGSTTPHHPLLSGQDVWELRTVLLLWLWILLTVPFDLSALDRQEARGSRAPSLVNKAGSHTLFAEAQSDLAKDVLGILTPLLHMPGKEGTFAALALARLLSRKDCSSMLPGFFDWAKTELEETERESEAHFVASLLEMLAVLPTIVPHEDLTVLAGFLDDVLVPHLRGGRTAAGSGLIRRLVVKAQGRWWVAQLQRDKQQGTEEMHAGLEVVLDDLLGALSDKNTIVRYSSAKYLARLAALLPSAFSEQIVHTTVGLFSGTEEEPVVETPYGLVVDPGGTNASEGIAGFGGIETVKGDARWHGTCLALAEMARRGLINRNAIGPTIQWSLKALIFDIRRASHSVGANVRDAAAYLFWSLARAFPTEDVKMWAEAIATRLVCVACLDREVGVRRAASAAFQEGVGRLSLYPEGIDTLAKTDFYSVSIRRLAFSKAAPAVAIHHVYRTALVSHLHNITLRHWDPVMRTQGSTTLRDLLALGPHLVPSSIELELSQISNLDVASVHGAVAALTQMASLLSETDKMRTKIMYALETVRPSMTISSQGGLVLQVICGLLSACLSSVNISDTTVAKLLDKFITSTMGRQEVTCQIAVAELMKNVSSLRDATGDVQDLLACLKSYRTAQRQASALALGHIQYQLCSYCMPEAASALLYQLDTSAKADVETRRYAIQSLCAICQQIDEQGRRLLSDNLFAKIFDKMTDALHDYTTDQRGDVGSWIRAAAIISLGQMIVFARRQREAHDDILISQGSFDTAVGGILKQGVEKLESVKMAAWRCFRSMRDGKVADVWDCPAMSVWDFPAGDDSDESFRYISAKDWYSSVMPLLRSRYRSNLISGLVFSLGSQAESPQNEALKAILQSLTPFTEYHSVWQNILQDLVETMRTNIQSNRVMIPTLLTCDRLLDTDALAPEILQDEANIPIISTTIIDVVSLASKGASTLKSIERLTAAMKLITTCVLSEMGEVRNAAVGQLHLFLRHRFPRIRVLTAETLYLKLTAVDHDLNEELEDCLLGTDWTSQVLTVQEVEKEMSCLITNMA